MRKPWFWIAVLVKIDSDFLYVVPICRHIYRNRRQWIYTLVLCKVVFLCFVIWMNCRIVGVTLPLRCRCLVAAAIAAIIVAVIASDIVIDRDGENHLIFPVLQNPNIQSIDFRLRYSRLGFVVQSLALSHQNTIRFARQTVPPLIRSLPHNSRSKWLTSHCCWCYNHHCATQNLSVIFW